MVPPLHEFLTKPQAAEPVGSWFNFWLCHLLAVSLGKSFNLPGVWAFLVAQIVKNLPTMQETQILSLGWKIPSRREWLSIPVFLPGEFHEQRSLVGYNSHKVPKESDATKQLTLFVHVYKNGFVYKDG